MPSCVDPPTGQNKQNIKSPSMRTLARLGFGWCQRWAGVDNCAHVGPGCMHVHAQACPSEGAHSNKHAQYHMLSAHKHRGHAHLCGRMRLECSLARGS